MHSRNTVGNSIPSASLLLATATSIGTPNTGETKNKTNSYYYKTLIILPLI